MAKTVSEDSHSSHTVLRPLRLPAEVHEQLDENGNKVGEIRSTDFPAPHRRPQYVPGHTVKLEPELAKKLVTAGVVAPAGCPNPEVLIREHIDDGPYDADLTEG